MQLRAIAKNVPAFPENLPIETYISEMLEKKTDFLIVVNDSKAFAGIITLYDLLSERSADEHIRQKTTLRPVQSFTTETNVETAIEDWESGNQIAVVADHSKYDGVVYLSDLLYWRQRQFQEHLSYYASAFNLTNAGFVIIDHNKKTKYEHSETPKECSFFPHIISAALSVQNRQENIVKEIEILYQGKKYLANISPQKVSDDETGHLITVQDTSKMKYFIVLETMFGSMREGVNIVDENGVLHYVNPSSAQYVNFNQQEMIGHDISNFYPNAVLLSVIKTRTAYFDQRLVFQGRVFIVNAVPLFVDGKFSGGIATFREVTEIIQLTNRIAAMEFELNISKHYDVFNVFIGSFGSLKPAIEKAQRCIASLGGPRHCVITGETGTGKSALARAMYHFAKRAKVLDAKAPFVEVNCGQFTNPDIAAMEIFGSEKGSFTGAQDKRGLIDAADGGIIFLDEAHALGPYQIMLLKVVEEGLLRRIGGRVDKKVHVIVIAASTKNLEQVLLPELYQRLAKYNIYLPSLLERPYEEKSAMINAFFNEYAESAKTLYGIILQISITAAAEKLLLSAYFQRNIRHFRDAVNSAIDSAAPPIFSISNQADPVNVVVDVEHIPADIIPKVSIIPEEVNPQEVNVKKANPFTQPIKRFKPNYEIDEKISSLYHQGYGARKIARILQEQDIDADYYHITYRIGKLRIKRE